jgi:hypothetical protein
MPKFNVMVNWTRTSTHSVEIEVSAKTEEAAQEKAEKEIAKVQKEAFDANGKSIIDSYDWDFTDEEDSFEYEVTEA